MGYYPASVSLLVPVEEGKKKQIMNNINRTWKWKGQKKRGKCLESRESELNQKLVNEGYLKT